METSNHCCCQNPGLKLGHTKTQTTNTAASTVQTTNSNAAASGQKRIYIPGYATIFTPTSDKMRGNFKLPGYEPTSLQSLPASPQTLFQKNQLLNMLQDFSKHMYDSILQNNISLPPSITLGLNSMGNINVLGSHPDQAKIESLFASGSPLATQFHQISFTSRLQQLANMQPDFTNAFFQQPSSLQQISFVQMRAVVLNPFQITINPANSNNTGTVNTQAPMAQGLPYHLQVSNPGAVAATTPATSTGVSTPTPAPTVVATSPSETGTQSPAKPQPPQFTIDDPVSPITVQPVPHRPVKQHPAPVHQDPSPSEQHRFTIDDPKPPTTTGDTHKLEKPHYLEVSFRNR